MYNLEKRILIQIPVNFVNDNDNVTVGSRTVFSIE